MRVHTLLLQLFIFLLVLFPLVSNAQINAGFVQGLWYSNDPFFADTEVRVYAALRNNADGDVTGTVQFLDNGELIRERRVSAVRGNVVDTWVDWTPSFGAHKIEALLTDVVLDGNEEHRATVTVSLAEDVRIVDYDTDGDGIGNSVDADDDNDGISDEVEIQNGTNPLIYDEPDEVNEDSTNNQENGSGSSNGSNARGNDENSDDNENNEDDEKRGFESFLNDGVAKTALGSIASVSNSIKDTIDTLRKNRATRRQVVLETEFSDDSMPAGKHTEETPGRDSETDKSRTGTHDSSIGEVTRSMNETESDKGQFNLIGLLSKILDGAYGAILLVLSLYFTYPGVVQFTLLFLALLVLYRIMHRLAKRPQD